MGGIKRKLLPVLVRYVFGPLGLSGPIVGASWTHSYSNYINSPNIVTYGIICMQLPTLPTPYHPPNLIYATIIISQ